MADFSQDQALDAAFIYQGLYKGGSDRRVALDPKEAFSNLNLISNFEALPAFPTNSDYQSGLASGQLAGVHSGPVPSESTTADRPNTLAEQSTSPSRRMSGSEQLEQRSPSGREVSLNCEHSQCNSLTFGHLSDWK